MSVISFRKYLTLKIVHESPKLLDLFKKESVYPSFSSLPPFLSFLAFDNYHYLVFILFFRYFLHYQWVPFYVVSLAILYYVPYLIFKSVNSDLISLVDTVENGNLRDVDKIANNYFNYRINSKIKMKIIIWVNLMIKVLLAKVISGFLRFLK